QVVVALDGRDEPRPSVALASLAADRAVIRRVELTRTEQRAPVRGGQQWAWSLELPISGDAGALDGVQFRPDVAASRSPGGGTSPAGTDLNGRPGVVDAEAEIVPGDTDPGVNLLQRDRVEESERGPAVRSSPIPTQRGDERTARIGPHCQRLDRGRKWR